MANDWTSRYRARIDTADFVRDAVRIVVAERRGDAYAVLLSDGAWETVQDGAMPAGDVGVVLPIDALEAVAEALQKHLGNVLPSQAEVAVLRQVLAKEQERVDTLFNATVRTIHGTPS